MESTLIEDEEKQKEKLNKKIIDTFAIFAIIILLGIFTFQIFTPSKFTPYYSFVSMMIYIFSFFKKPYGQDRSDFFNECMEFLNEPITAYLPIIGDINIAPYNLGKGLSIMAIYITVTELLSEIPIEMQKLIFGEKVFHKDKNFLSGKNLNSFSEYIGGGCVRHQINTFISIIHIVNILTILVYFTFKNDIGKASGFWSMIVMFYVMLYTFFVLPSVSRKVWNFMIIFITIGIVAYMLSLGMTPEEQKEFYPGPEMYLVKRILLFIPCFYIYLVNIISQELNTASSTNSIILSINIVVIILYFVFSNLSLYKPKLLLNEPVYLNKEKIIGTDLGSDIEDVVNKDLYKNGISFWFNLFKVQERDADYNIINITDKIQFTYNEKYDELKLHVNKIQDYKESENVYKDIEFHKALSDYKEGDIVYYMNDEATYTREWDVSAVNINGDDTSLDIRLVEDDTTEDDTTIQTIIITDQDEISEYSPETQESITTKQSGITFQYNPEVLFSLHNIKYQKWNNIIFNYKNGSFDLFMNGKLMTSQPNVTLYNLPQTNIIVGQENGVNGGICNVKYFDNPLSTSKIENLYNNSKDKNPPVI